MLSGRVNRSGEPVVTLQIILHDRPVTVSAIIDTGFNGYLSVPQPLLVGGRWRVLGTEKFELATGAVVEQQIYLGEVRFMGRRTLVYTVATEAQEVLIGTQLLRGCILTVDFRTRRVTVT